MAPCRSYRKLVEKFVGFFHTQSLYQVLIYSVILLIYTAILSAEAAQNDRFPTKFSSNCDSDNKNPNCGKPLLFNRTPRQQQNMPSESLTALINWLFGRPANSKPPTGHSAVNSTSDSQNSIAKPEPKVSQPIEIISRREDVSKIGQMEASRNTNSSVASEDPLAAHFRQKNKKNIEITDIQASIGTELHSSQSKDVPSQQNLRDDLELVEKFDQSVKQLPHSKLKSSSSGRTGRLKREPYKPIKVPYTTTKSQDMTNNILRQRQLYVNPFDQQMMALQQQQAAAAAAAMLQQQQVDNLLNGNRYPILDDYDKEDDDDSDEDSDEFDDFTPFGPPMIEHHHMFLRNGLPQQVPVPPFQRKLGWGLGRRSVSDKRKQQRRKLESGDGHRSRDKMGGSKNVRRAGGKFRNRASLKTGQWLLDDYDLNSEFHSRPQERKNIPNIERPELDEEEHYENHNKNIPLQRENTRDEMLKHKGDMDYMYRGFRDSLCEGNECLQPRQEEESHTDTSEGSSVDGESSSEGSMASESTSEGSMASESTTEGSMASESTSEGSMASESTSEGSMVSESTSEGSMASESTSEGSMASESTSEGSMASESTSEGSMASESTSEGSMASESTSEGSMVSESTSEGSMASESTTEGSMASESTSEGSMVSESTSEGSSEGSTTVDGSSTDGSDTSDGTTTGGSDSSSTTETSETTTKPKPKPPYRATLNCRCGTQSVRGGVIGDGTVVRINVNPWLVAISDGDSHICSGSIINDRFVMTSKSCIQGFKANSLNVTAGQTSSNSTNYKVTKISSNPNVNIALLQLSSPIKPNHMMRPVCLPLGKRYAGNYSTATLVTFKKVAKSVQVVDTEVSILGNKNPKCKTTSKGTLCAGPPGSMKCGGDTGGVLMVYRGGYSYEQIGVVAGTVGCRATGSPGIYTDIRKRTRWILNNSKDGNYCKSPAVTDEDLMSTTRLGDPYFELNEDFEDTRDFENGEFGEESNNSGWEDDDNQSAEVLDSSIEEQ